MDHDLTIDEKRVYADRTGAVAVLVAAEQGLVVASLSADLVGEFGLDHRAPVRDVAAAGNRRVVATAEDVLVGTYDPTDFGPAVAVGFDHGGAPVAAGPDGRVARLDDGWTTLGTVEDPRAVDGGMIAAADGVHRIVDDGLRDVGLSAVADVHGRGCRSRRRRPASTASATAGWTNATARSRSSVPTRPTTGPRPSATRAFSSGRPSGSGRPSRRPRRTSSTWASPRRRRWR
ncbi:hypothetical protein ACFQL0_01775 [Haloplanus litoreus]